MTTMNASVISSSTLFQWLPSPPFSRRRTKLGRAIALVYLASLAHTNVRSNKVLTKRDLYYMRRDLFPSMQVVQRTLDWLSRALDTPATHLHIVAAAKGLVAGPLTFTDESHARVSVGAFLPDAAFIPARSHLVTDVSFDAAVCGEGAASWWPSQNFKGDEWMSEGDHDVDNGDSDGDHDDSGGVLVVEKETVFRTLLAHPDAKRLLDRYVLITGKGKSLLIIS